MSVHLSRPNSSRDAEIEKEKDPSRRDIFLNENFQLNRSYDYWEQVQGEIAALEIYWQGFMQPLLMSIVFVIF